MSNKRLKLIEEMLSSNKDDQFLNYAAALEYKKIGENNRSIELLERIISSDASYIAAYYQLGKLYEEADKIEDAIKVYRQGIKEAHEKNDMKTLGELTEALMIIDDEFDGSY